MLSFRVKFVQTDRWTDERTTVKQYAPDLPMWGDKKPIQNIAGKEENVSNQGFLLFSQSIFCSLRQIST